MKSLTPQFAASLLSSDFASLGAEVKAVTQAGVDRIHIDVMDGHFVPTLTLGPETVKAIRPYSSLPFDVHLMVTSIEPLIDQFAKAGADSLIIHPEAAPHPHRYLQKIRSHGKKAGIALNPDTPPSILEYLLDELDFILVMTVNPGAGGQSFIHSQLKKIERISQKIKDLPIQLAVDGGINESTASHVISAGAHILVAGTSLFNNKNYAENLLTLRRTCYPRL